MAFWDVSLSDLIEQGKEVFFDDENSAGDQIAEETRQAEADQRQEAAPVGSGGTVTGSGGGIPVWVWWVGGALVLLVAAKPIAKAFK